MVIKAGAVVASGAGTVTGAVKDVQDAGLSAGGITLGLFFVALFLWRRAQEKAGVKGVTPPKASHPFDELPAALNKRDLAEQALRAAEDELAEIRKRVSAQLAELKLQLEGDRK